MNLRYQNVIKSLEDQRELIIATLKTNPEQKTIDLKVEIEMAIRWLRAGQHHDIDPNANIVKLPQNKTLTSSSEFRIIEDHESDDKQHWKEIEINGTSFRPTPGSIVIDASSKI